MQWAGQLTPQIQFGAPEPCTLPSPSPTSPSAPVETLTQELAGYSPVLAASSPHPDPQDPEVVTSPTPSLALQTQARSRSWCWDS